MSTSSRLRVDDERLWLPLDLVPGTTYDVVVNGLHVWSIEPSRDTRRERSSLVATWPKALKRYLLGRAEVAVRDHVEGTPVGSTSYVFGGDASTEVSVTDGAGRPLIMDKWDRLSHPLSAADSSIVEELMDHAERLLTDLRERAGVPSYVCYGTLLGAVRNGRLIGHDNDLDVAYVSEHPHPVDVVREGFRVERALRAAGWAVRRGSSVRLNVRLRMSDGSHRAIDVFTSHWVEGRLYIPSDTGFELPRETILPLSTVTLMGRELPAPADPERLLAAQYGEGWRLPDPSFKYPDRPWLTRRFTGWFGGLSTRRKHWDRFAVRAHQEVPKRPSPFARWVAKEYPSHRPLVDVGTGTARDALWFARRHGREVLGIDFVMQSVRRANRRSRRDGLDARFEEVNLNDSRAALALGARLGRLPDPPDVYVRFTMHDLEPGGRDNVLRLASMALRRGGLLFLEFRTPRDRGRRKVFRDHLRRFVAPADMRTAVEAAGGRVVYLVEGTGLAPFRGEDPHLCRLVARWSEDPATDDGDARPTAVVDH